MRFVLMDKPPDGYAADAETKWWKDTERPLFSDPAGFVCVQTYADKDANDYRRIALDDGGLDVLFTDQAEFYIVCAGCHAAYRHMQWTGSTHVPNWDRRAAKKLEKHMNEKGWCEFCDPVFGNGGWPRRSGEGGRRERT